MDLGRFNSILTLGGLEGSSDDGFLDEDGIVFLLKAEELLDVVSSLGTELSGKSNVSETYCEIQQKMVRPCYCFHLLII